MARGRWGAQILHWSPEASRYPFGHICPVWEHFIAGTCVLYSEDVNAEDLEGSTLASPQSAWLASYPNHY